MIHAINHSILLQSEPKALASYLRELLEYHEERDISKFLFSAVEKESLPPTIFSIWLNITASTTTLFSALKQDFSIYIRYAAIKRFKQLIRRRNWAQAWNGIGGTQGILTLLSTFSVHEVKKFISSFPRQLNSPENAEQREKVTELLQGLYPSIYHDSPFKTLDERPLANTYSILVPGCTSKFVDGVLRTEKSPLIRYHNKAGIIRHHYELLRDHCLSVLKQDPIYPIHVNEYFDSLSTTSPPLPSHKHGFSESMLFSMNFLQEHVARSDLQLPGKSILTIIIEPLVRRARRKRLPWSDIGEIMDLAIKYLNAHPEEDSLLSFRTGSFMHFSAIFWAVCTKSLRPEFEGRLVSVLRHVTYERPMLLQQFRNILIKVPRSLRYRLLRIIFLNMPNVKADINTLEGLIESESWPFELFLDIESHEAIAFINRLNNVNKADTFLQKAKYGGNTIFTLEPSQHTSRYSSSALLRLFLEKSEPGSMKRFTLAVEQHKGKAAKSRDQEDRAFNAKFALVYAITSGSLALYGETLLWCRRWIRDPLTAKSVFSRGVINVAEAINLLSGIPTNSDDKQHYDLSDVKDRVIEANKVMFTLFETVCLTLKEPSFHIPDWLGCRQIPYQVITERIRQCEEVLKRLQNPSEQEIYDTLWSDTLDLALRIEKISLEPGYEALSSRTLPAPSITWRKISPATYRFIDDLASRRDLIWRQYRISKNPLVTLLPQSVPQGLPIQDFGFSIDLAVEEASGLTPYIYSRSMSIVFQNTKTASTQISSDKETREAIGTFIDSFTFALKIFVFQGPVSGKESRVSRAWTHALESLSYRMAPDEAYRTWRDIFQTALPKVVIPSIDPVQSNEYPRVPYTSDSIEWNPAEDFHPLPAVEPRRLEPQIYLDCSIATLQNSYGHGDAFQECPLETTGFKPGAFDIWNTMRFRKGELRIPAVREGLIISALLYIDSQTDDGSRLLKRPFPSTSDTRYPAVWLDLEFSNLGNVGISEAIYFFGENFVLSTVPPTLLLKLAKGAIDHSAKVAANGPVSHGTNLEGRTCNIVSLLTRSDRPHLAIDLVLKIIMEYPDASSWHRQILSNNFIKRLSAEQSRDLIHRFSSAIQNKMREKAKISKTLEGTISSESTPHSKSYVKITTIKYLAQLLKGALFVSRNFSAGVLSELLLSSTQIDIRLTVVNSLLEILDGCNPDTDDALGNNIVSALEGLIPVAGDLDERRQLQEEDWALAKKDLKLPEVFEKGTVSLSDSVPPILEVLMQKRFGLYEDHWKVQRVTKLLIPILEQSILSHHKWLEIFAIKYGLNLASLQLPVLPVKAKVLKTFIHSYIKLVPASFLDLYHRFVLINISCPQEIAEFNRKIEGPKYRELQETKHWLSMFGQAPSNHYYRNFELLSAIFELERRGRQSTCTNCITMSQVENLAFSQAQYFIYHSDPSELELFMGPLEPRPGNPYGNSQSAKALIKRLVTLIDSLRTPAWQSDRSRNPEVLPKTLKYRIWLLPFPAQEASDVGEIKRFTIAIRQLLEELCAPGTTYHHDLAEFNRAVHAAPESRCVEIACALGQLKTKMQTSDLLNVEVASKFLFTASTPNDTNVITTARKLVESWRASENEWIRALGKRCLEKGNFGRSTLHKKWAETLIGRDAN